MTVTAPEFGARQAAAPGPAARWLAVAGLVAVHFGIQVAARNLVVYRQFVDDPALLRAGSWLHYVNHHAAQMLVGLALIALLTRGRTTRAGLNVRNAGASWRLLTRGFFPVFLVTLIAAHTLVPILQGVPPQRFAGDVRPLDLLGMLAFAWVLVGISEEIVFRGFFQTAAAEFWHGSVQVFGVAVPKAGVVAAVIFTIAHVSFRPLAADPRQLVLAFVLGIYYAVAYDRTGSLLAPIAAHNLVDGGIITAEWLVTGLAFG